VDSDQQVVNKELSLPDLELDEALDDSALLSLFGLKVDKFVPQNQHVNL